VINDELDHYVRNAVVIKSWSKQHNGDGWRCGNKDARNWYYTINRKYCKAYNLSEEKDYLKAIKSCRTLYATITLAEGHSDNVVEFEWDYKKRNEIF